MAKAKLTAGRVASFKCDEGKLQDFLWCEEVAGLAVRATPNSIINRYIFQTKVQGKTMRVTIGKVSVWSIKDAQSEARRLQVEIDKGNDPRQQLVDKAAENIANQKAKVEAAAAEVLQQKREAFTLGMLWPIYINDKRKGWSEWNIRDHENIALKGGQNKVRGKGLTADAPLASLLNVRLVDLTPTLISSWLAKEAQTRPTRASLALRLLSAFMSWCEEHEEYKGLVTSGACQSLQVKKRIPKKKTKVGDSLQREQLGLWFESVNKLSNIVQSAYLQCLLITGARRREIAELKWTDVDFQWLSMTIRDKVDGERTIPLTPYVAYLISRLPRRNEWVFSSTTSATGHIEEPKQAHKRALESVGLPDLSIHGLRRSFATLSEWTEVPAGIAAQISGYKPQGVRENNYIRRPLDLLRMWHIKIEDWILNEAGITFEPVKAGLHVVKTA